MRASKKVQNNRFIRLILRELAALIKRESRKWNSSLFTASSKGSFLITHPHLGLMDAISSHERNRLVNSGMNSTGMELKENI